jgi:hypothetical protein
MATKRTGHTGGPNPPGYVPPSRRGKAPLWIQRELVAEIRSEAARIGVTPDEIVTRRLNVPESPAVESASPAGAPRRRSPDREPG